MCCVGGNPRHGVVASRRDTLCQSITTYPNLQMDRRGAQSGEKEPSTCSVITTNPCHTTMKASETTDQRSKLILLPSPPLPCLLPPPSVNLELNLWPIGPPLHWALGRWQVRTLGLLSTGLWVYGGSDQSSATVWVSKAPTLLF